MGRYFTMLAFLQLTGLAASQRVDYFWQLTDYHYDPWWKENEAGSCNIELQQHGPYGDFECDTPWELVQSSIQAMKTLDRDQGPAFVLLSGDHSPHPKKKDKLNEDVIIEIAQNITNALREVYPDTLMLPVLGNHDYWPKPALPANRNKIYDSFAEMWRQWLDDREETLTTFRNAGFYSRPITTDGNIQAVVLNTILHFAKNPATANMTDPGNQFEWVEQALSSIRDKGQKAFLFFHAPVGKVPRKLPGSSFLRPEQNARLSNIIASYSDVIIGTFSGHIHADSYMLFYSDQDDPVSAMFICPAVTPWRHRYSATNPAKNGPAHNPALRKVVYSPESFELLQIQQYYLNLEKANEEKTAVWELAYNFTELYDIPDLSPASLQGLLEKMSEDDSPEFESFVQMNLVNTDHPSIKPCNCSCKTSHLCGIQYVHYDAFDACYGLQKACVGSFSAADMLQPSVWPTLLTTLIINLFYL